MFMTCLFDMCKASERCHDTRGVRVRVRVRVRTIRVRTIRVRVRVRVRLRGAMTHDTRAREPTPQP